MTLTPRFQTARSLTTFSLGIVQNIRLLPSWDCGTSSSADASASLTGRPGDGIPLPAGRRSLTWQLQQRPGERFRPSDSTSLHQNVLHLERVMRLRRPTPRPPRSITRSSRVATRSDDFRVQRRLIAVVETPARPWGLCPVQAFVGHFGSDLVKCLGGSRVAKN